MNTQFATPAVDTNDAELVEQSLAGDRQAFGRIVARYQSLVCALAYSATGSRTQSEDLAQETFLVAWRKLRDLREPRRLCAWLCGIARNIIHGDRRRLEHQPAHGAIALDAAIELPSTEPSPSAQAVSNEEMAILWREVGRLPEIYREPLILFYRDHKSVEHVAEALGLTPDAVMQRMSRGRRQLQERMLEFVETTLQRTNPGPEFTQKVHAALAIPFGAGPAALGLAGNGGAATKGGSAGLLMSWIAPFVGLFAAMGMSWAEISGAQSGRERRFAIRWMLVLWLSVLAFVLALPRITSLAWAAGGQARQDWTATAPEVALWFVFSLFAVTLIVLMARGKAALRRQVVAEGLVQNAPPSVTPTSMRKRVALTIGFLVSLFWVPVFLAWQTGDRAVALGIACGVILLGAAPFAIGRRLLQTAGEARVGNWYVMFCGLVFLALLNWRLDVWLPTIYGVDAETMSRLLPMEIVHWLSVIAIAWTAALVFVTRPDEKR